MLDAGGIGTYLAETLPRVVARMPDVPFTVLGDERRLSSLVGVVGSADVVHWATPIYTVREQFDVRRSIPRDTALFWSPHFNIPVAWRGRLMVTVHDVAHLALPQSTLPRTLYARFMFAAVRRRATTVLCDSAFTARELRRLVGQPRRSVVCHLGVADRWFELQRTPEPSPYLLYVGNVKPHKNLGRLLAAFSRVADRIPHRLVIAGRREGMRTVDDEAVRQADRLGERVEFTGYVPPDMLEQYMAGCDALVLPSLYEGFGLPPLEALACGRAVAVARSASLPEVCGPHAEYFDPLDVDSMAAALERVATRPPDTAEVKATRIAWARRFDWDTCADRVAVELRAALAASALPLASASA